MIVDCNDYYIMADTYGLCVGDDDYNDRVDMDGDGCVNDVDRSLMYPWGIKVCDLSARAKSGKVQLTWTHVGADSYNVYRYNYDDPTLLLIANTTNTYSTYLDYYVENGTVYCYYVKCVCNLEEGDVSNLAVGMPTARVRR
ncbi:MAG: hypothetical protein ABIA02_00740 [Candidatus Falkowbacteria bacterium]